MRFRQGVMKARKILFIDRDGTLITEPPDEQIDSFEKFALVDGVIPALRRCVAAGYELVMVTNQDGLGTPSFPQASFDGPQNLLLQILRSQGVGFRDVLIDGSFSHEGKDTRKPGIGMDSRFRGNDGSRGVLWLFQRSHQPNTQSFGSAVAKPRLCRGDVHGC